jgi:thioredoxin-like negative regulator of GroEL
MPVTSVWVHIDLDEVLEDFSNEQIEKALDKRLSYRSDKEINEAVALVRKGRYEDALSYFQDFIEDHAAKVRAKKYLDWKKKQTAQEEV